jgi:D-glycero-alpha-D-manno-heptose-7-phosphate kinase
MIIGIAPVRISFAGGGTDMPEFYENYGGQVLSTTINRFTYVIIDDRIDNAFQAFSPDFQKHYKPTKFDKIEIEDGVEIAASIIKYFKYKKGTNVILFSDAPGGSGLGSSSSLTVNLVNTISNIMKKKMDKRKIAETAFKIERNILHWPIGKQDEYSSSFGGMNFIKFYKNKVSVEPVKLSKSSNLELEKNLLLFFVGKTRNSSDILHDQIQLIKNKNSNTIDSLNHVKDLAEKLHDSLKKSDINKFGEFLDEGWEAKKKFTHGVTNKTIDRIYKIAKKEGATGGKLTGAGGGGHMLLYCEARKQKKVIEKMKKAGLQEVKFRFFKEGPTILNLYDYLQKRGRL